MTPSITRFISLLCLILRHSAEYVVNKPASKLSCGVTEDCWIICNKANSCQDSTFHVYNNIIHIECSAYESCFRTKIVASNVKLLNLTVSSNANAFVGSDLTTDNGGDIIINCIERCDAGTFDIKKAKSLSIYCSGDHSCEFSHFHTEESPVTMTCSGSSSCYYVEIEAVNVSSFTLNITEEYGFDHGFFSSDADSQQITVNCVSRFGCNTAIFFYNSPSITQHNCRQWLACSPTIIYAVGPVALDCVDHSTACEDMEIIFPVNKTYYMSSSINISSPCFSSTTIHCIRVWSIYHMIPTINYVGGRSIRDLHKVWIIYGYRFDHFCRYSDTECVQNAAQIDDETISIWDTYYGHFGRHFDFSAYSNRNNQSVLLILSDSKATSLVPSQIFTPPMINGDAYLSIFCIFCNDVLFNFESLQKVAMTYTSRNNADAIERSTILGPQKRFILNSYAYSQRNTYFLNHTMEITINSISGGTVYTADQTNVSIRCDGMRGCHSSDIYSSLNPVSVPIFTAWTLDCVDSPTDPGLFDCAYNFHIHFPAINETCAILRNGLSNCGFLTAPPTFSPTSSPSGAPTGITDHPSFAPTNEPTNEPTNDPTVDPTVEPTTQPSINPTTQPSIDSTTQPTINPISISRRNSFIGTKLFWLFIAIIPFCIFTILFYFLKWKREHTTMNEKNEELMNEVNQIELKTIQHIIQPDDYDRRYQRLMEELKKSIIDMDINHIIQLIDDHHSLLQHLRVIDRYTSNYTCDDAQCPILQKHPAFDITGTQDQLSTQYIDQIIETIHCFWLHPKDVKMMQTRMNKRYTQLYDNGSYIFGSYFNYGDNLDEKPKNCKHFDVQPKYANLKEELTLNKISCVTNEQYLNEDKKATLHWRTPWRKEEYPTITAEHILALMIYCNFDILSHEFSKTYRESSGDRHVNFYHLGRLLKQAVLQYGTCVKDGNIKEFYHGVNQQLIPIEIVGDLGKGVSIYCPLSTSSSFEVATNFTDQNQGIVITFGDSSDPSTSKAKYFAAAWLSDYPQEKEHLFLQNNEELQIINVTDCATSFEFNEILEALKSLDAILYDSHYGPKIKMHRLIIVILHHQLSVHHGNPKEDWKPFSSLVEYGRKLLDVYFENKKSLSINYSVLEQKYTELFKLFCLREYDWIKIDVLRAIFREIKKIEIKSIKLCSNTMNDILSNGTIFRRGNDTWDLNEMTLKADKSSPLAVLVAEKEYKRQFKESQFKIIMKIENHRDGFDTLFLQ